MRAEAVDVLSGKRAKLPLKPSTARDCRGGFAAISRFFPEGKTLLASIEEQLWDELYGLGYDHDQRILDRVRTLPLEEVNAVARRYFSGIEPILSRVTPGTDITA